MSFAVRPNGLANSKGWGYMGESFTQTDATVLFPFSAEPGDLALLIWSSTVAGSAPAGWTQLAAGTSTHYYKICSGGENSVARPNTGQGGVLMLRAFKGNATYSGGISQSPSSSDQTLTKSKNPGLLVCTGNAVGTTNDFLLTAPGDNMIPPINLPTGPSLYVALRSIAPDATLNGLRLSGSNNPRQSFALFHIP